MASAQPQYESIINGSIIFYCSCSLCQITYFFTADVVLTSTFSLHVSQRNTKIQNIF